MKKRLSIIILAISCLCLAIEVNAQSYNDLDLALKEPLNVKSLILNEKNIVRLPVEIDGLKNLEVLSLQSNKEIDLPDLFTKISGLPRLMELNISSCDLKEIPKEIKLLKNLRKLRIGVNKLNKLPREIGELSNLRELIFSQYPDDFRGFELEEKKKILALLPRCKILLEDYFGGVHGHYRLGKKVIRITYSNLDKYKS